MVETPRSVNAVATAAARIVAYVVGFVASVLIARALGPEGRGQYFVLVSIATTATAVGHLSIEHAALYFWPREEDRRRLIGAILVAGLVLGVLAAAVAGVLVVALSDVLALDRRNYLPLAVAAIPFSITVLYLNSALVAGGRVGVVNRAMLFSSVAQALAIAVLFATDTLSVGTVLVVWLVGTAFPFALQIPALAREPGLRWPGRRYLGRLIALGARYHPGMIAAYLVLRVDVFMLQAQRGSEAVGHYSLAVTLAEAAFLVVDAASVVTVSQILKDTDDRAYTTRVVRTNAALAIAVQAAACLVAPAAVPLLFGGSFRPAIPVLWVLAPGMVALAVLRPLGVFANQQNRPVVVSSIHGGGLLLNVALNLVLIPRLGVVGPAVASSIAYWLVAISFTVWFVRASGVRMGELAPQWRDVVDPLGAVVVWAKTRGGPQPPRTAT